MQKHISIPKPCHENWQEMSPKEQGRHCDKCDKIVTDFSAMNNEEILSFLQNQKGEVCGRVRKNQLSTNIKLNRNLKQFLYVLAIAFLSVTPIILPAQTSAFSVNDRTYEDPGGIDGKLKNIKNESIANCKVIALQNGKIIITSFSDKNGNYKIKPLISGLYTLKFITAEYNQLVVTDVTVRAGRSYTVNKNLVQLDDKSKIIRSTDKRKPKPYPCRIENEEPTVIGQVHIEQENYFRSPYPWYKMIDKLRFNK